MTWPLSKILREVRPTIHREWMQVFLHLSQKPWKWEEDVATHGIVNPVSIRYSNVGPHLTDGHHRIWLAWKLGIQDVPVQTFDDR